MKMKNYIFSRYSTLNSVLSSLVIITAMLLTVSCEKEETTVIQNQQTSNVEISPNVSVIDGRLVLKTVESYESLITKLSTMTASQIDDWENSIGYKSLRNTISQEELLKSGYNDLIFSSLINSDGIIQIENFVFKVDLKNGLVYALPEIDFSAETVSFTNTKHCYSVESNVIGIVFNNENCDLVSKACDSEDTGWYTWSTSGGAVEYRIRYFKAGIYFTLNAEIQKDHYGGAEYIYLETYNGSTSFYRRNSSCYTYTDNDGGYNKSYNLRMFQGTLPRTAFRYYVTFYLRDEGYSGNPTAISHLVIKCNENDGC